MKIAILLPLSGLALLALLPAACRQESAKPADLSISATGDQKIFSVQGVLQLIKPNGTTAIIKHEEIPDYMPAMTMPLDVKDKKELAGLKPGDNLSFRMIVTKDDAWIDQVKKIAPPAITVTTNAATPPDRTFRRAPIVEPLNVGDALPDYKFTNQLGQPISLAGYKGQAVALTFIFTRCPFPLFCPRMNENFLATQKALLARPDGPKNWQLLSLSFDPVHDTPEVLKNYAAQHAHNPAHWSFATAELYTIDGITEQFGVQFWNADGTINHNLRTVVIDTKGRVQRIFPGNEWKADELVAELVKAAGVK